MSIRRILSAALMFYVLITVAQAQILLLVGPDTTALPNLYWVGGSGNTSDRQHWAEFSGGPGDHVPPTASTTCNFDSSSAAASYTVTFDVATTCLNVVVANPASGAPTFAGTASLTISGSMTLVSGMGWSYTGTITFNATATGKTITTAGVTLSNSLTFNGVGGGWTFQDNLTTGAANTLLLTAGTLSTNAKTVTAGIFDSNGSAARTATLTNSTINLTGSAATVWQTTTTTNGTFTVTGSTVNVTGGNWTIRVGGVVLPNLIATTAGTGITLIAAGTFGNLTVLAVPFVTNVTDNAVSFGVVTVTGTLTFTGASQVSRLAVSNSAPTTLTAAVVSLTNVDFQNTTGAGAATWTGTSIGDWGGNSNITFTSPVIRFWVGNGGVWSDAANHWSASSGGAPNATIPLPQDSALVDANSFTLPGQTLTLDYVFYPETDFSAVTNNPTLFLFTGGNFYGSLTLNSSMTIVGNGASSVYSFFNHTGTATLTTAGLALPISLTSGNPSHQGSGGTLSLGDNLTLTPNGGTTGSLTVSFGTFNANNHNPTATSVTSNTSAAHPHAIIMGSGTWTLTAPTGNVWNVASSGMTLTPNTSTIKVSGTPTGARTFAGAGLTYNNLEWDAEGITSQLNITGANTFGTITADADTVPRTLQLPQSAAQTATGLALNGASGNLLSVISGLAGTRSTISIASGVIADTFLSLKDQAATGGATFAATSSVNAGNNSGWVITP